MTLELNIYGSELTVEFYYDAGSAGDYFNPPCGAEVEIESVKAVDSNVELYDLLNKSTFLEITDKINEYYNN